MDFSFNDDHLALRDAVQRFCAGEYPAEQRGNAVTPEQAQQGRAAMAELGLLGLPFSSDMGGSEQGAVEVMLVAQELGLHLIVGSEFLWGDLRVVVLARDAEGWGNLCEFITAARRAAPKIMRSSVPILNLQMLDWAARLARWANGTPDPPWMTRDQPLWLVVSGKGCDMIDSSGSGRKYGCRD